MNKIQSFFNKLVDNSGFGTFAGKRSVDLSGANSIFGTMGAGAFPILSHMDFIPTDGQKGILELNQPNEGAKWIGLNTPVMQFWAYVYCSPLAAVIDRIAESDTNGILRFVNEETGIPIKHPDKNPRLKRLKALINRPNPWQTWEEYEAEQVVLCKTHGCCPVWAIGPGFDDKTYTKALINLNRAYATPIQDDNFSIFDEVNSEKPKSRIKAWRVTIGSKTFEIPSSEIFIVKDGFLTKQDEFGLPLSKINGMDFSVSNIIAAMEAQNVILKKKGPLGIFSYDPAGKDMAGTTPFDPKAADALQKYLDRYGLTIGQLQYYLSKMPIKFHATSFPLKDLMTQEIIRGGMDFICDRFSYPAELMSGKNATYENRSSSEKWVYNNNVIPFSMRRMKVYNNFFQLEGSIMRKTYDHLDVLQEDIVKAGEAEEAYSNAMVVQWEAGMITWNQCQVMMERDPVEGMDIYYPEYIKKYPAMNKNQPKQLEKPKDKKDGKDKASSKDTGTEE